MFFYIKPIDDSTWTGQLSHLTSRAYANSTPLSLDGPYGNLSINLSHYHTVYIIAGGIGITPFLNILDLVQSNTKYATISTVHVHWSICGLSLYNLFSEKISSYTADTSSIETNEDVMNIRLFQRSVNIIFTIYNTGIDTLDSIDNLSIPSRIQISSVRMDIEKIITSNIKLTTEKHCLLICGPASMSSTATTLAAYEKIDFHNEVFSY
jgi:hypothetical protein